MALTTQEQELLDFALSALPRWVRSDDPHLRAAAKTFGLVRQQIDYWFQQTLITQADGPAAGLPDWLNQHARDRGTNRQAGESNAALRDRIRNVPDSLTRASLVAAANAILAAESISGTATMVELPREGAFTGTYTSDAGGGGTWTAGSGTSMIFTPTVPFGSAPYHATTVVRRIQKFRLVTSGSADVANNGSRIITGLSGNGAIVTNAGGVVGADPGVSWQVQKLDHLGNVRDGHMRSHSSTAAHARYRSLSRRPVIIMILPYGSTPSTEVSVREMLRQKKAAGFLVIVERRLTPP
jgi:hypothetical protein